MAHPIALERLLASTLLVLAVAACAASQPRDARYDDTRVYRGWVTDAATGKPIEGAVVVAAWKISRRAYLMMRGIPDHDVVGLAEVLTDKDGRFEFAPLGEHSLPLGWEKDENSYPRFAFFKPGYEPMFRDEITWDQDVLAEHFFNPATATRRGPTGEQEVQIFPYLTRPERSSVIDPSVKSGSTEQKIERKLDSFASTLSRNVEHSDDNRTPLSRRRREAVEAQWRAIVMVDEEIRKYKPNYEWNSSTIAEALRNRQRKKEGPR